MKLNFNILGLPDVQIKISVIQMTNKRFENPLLAPIKPSILREIKNKLKFCLVGSVLKKMSGVSVIGYFMKIECFQVV